MITFIHTNIIITDDWKRLATFYINVFDCKPIYPEIDLHGTWLDKTAPIPNVRVAGMYLTLPGYGDNLPRLGIFHYVNNESQPLPLANRKGLGYMVFKVKNVQAMMEKILATGGSQLGNLVQAKVKNLGTQTFVYAQDIDGNIIELQHCI